MAGSDLLLAGVLFLFAAVIAVPLASRLGIGAVLGYLLAGIAIGPWGLGFISDVDEILHFSELGVVFLMFIIGLELNPAKLWRLRSSIFGVGAAQVMLSAAILGGLLMTTGFSWQAAVVGGIGLAMSSTAMALQLMREKGMSRSESGQLGFSVLLFQDLAVIPALALVPLLAGSADEHVNWLTVGMKVLAFAGMLIGGRYLLRPVFRFIASSGVREVFTAATLLLVLGSALFMEALGLSMALGTFIAGVLLAESEYRHELEIAIDPFKGLLLGLFFISVGMALNLGVLYTHLLWVAVSVAVLVAVKLTSSPFSAVTRRSVRPSTLAAAARICSLVPSAVAAIMPRAASWAASSSGVPWAATLPCAIISTRSQIVCTSLRIWLERMTVWVSPRSWMRLRISIIWAGSRPTVGSSRMITLGLPSSAAAMPTRWR